MIFVKFTRIEYVREAMGKDRPFLLESIGAVGSTFESVVLGHRAICIDDCNSEVCDTRAFLDASPAQREPHQVVEEPHTGGRGISKINIEQFAKPCTVFGGLKCGLAEGIAGMIAIAVKKIERWRTQTF